MIEFANPSSLWLALAVPLLLWWWLRQRRPALRHPAVDRLPPLPDRRARRARWGGTLLRGLALLALVVASAGPRIPDLHTRIQTEGIALALVVDVSGSMAEPDFDWQAKPVSRLDAAKKVFNQFVFGSAADGAAGFEGRARDLIALVTFASRPETICPLTSDHKTLGDWLADEKPRSIPGESETNLSDAITEGLERLQHTRIKRKVLVLLTDGEHNVMQPRSGLTPWQTGQVAAALGVPIYTIDAGGTTAVREGPPKDKDVPDTPSSPGLTRQQAVQRLQELSRMTRGQYFAANDTDALLRACQTIDGLERTEVTTFQYRRYHEGYPYLAVAALALFSLAIGLEMTLWRRAP
jgi:Ca-activated chloride channel family protein